MKLFLILTGTLSVLLDTTAAFTSSSLPSSSAGFAPPTSSLQSGVTAPSAQQQSGLNSSPSDDPTTTLAPTPSIPTQSVQEGAPPGAIRRMFPNYPWSSLPDLLTNLRLLSIPLLAVLFYHPSRRVSAPLVFGLSSYTDYLDGYLARRWNACTEWGAFADPVADKLLVCTALCLLSGMHGAAFAVPAAVVVGREIAVSALRELMAGRGMRDAVKVGYLGKVKTAATMVAVTAALAAGEGVWGGRALRVGRYGLWGCAGLTVWSAVPYFRAFFEACKRREEGQ